MHVCDPRTQGVEAGGSKILGHIAQYQETWPKQ